MQYIYAEYLCNTSALNKQNVLFSFKLLKISISSDEIDIF